VKKSKVFENLIRELSDYFEKLPDYRQGVNTRYEIKDAVVSAFSVFFTQSPSFLASQRLLQKKKGKNNLLKLFGVEHIPTDPQIRNLLDTLEPSLLSDLFPNALKMLEESDGMKDFESHAGQILISTDGTETISSQKIHCQNCLHRELRNGETQYFHAAILPVIVKAGNPSVLPLFPEFITPQDGHEKQDCEREATKRWVKRNIDALKGWRYTMLGDDLYANQPLCESFIGAELNFILVCKPDSHKELYKTVDFLAKNGLVEEVVERHWNGRYYEKHTYRFVNEVPLRQEEPLLVNWFEVIITNEGTGEKDYHNSFVTNHKVSMDCVAALARDGRARWKSENETNNTLKNQGYHFEHNFGHGEKHLANFLATLNLLAFLLHSLLNLVDEQYQLLRAELVTRMDFFNDLRALLRYMVFDSWDALMIFMLRALEVPGYT
jgi:hypothetical protein